MLKGAVPWGWGWTHNDAAMTIGFDSSIHLEPQRLRMQFIPTTQIEGRLLFAGAKF
jgi:hypothetical protein